MVLKRVMSFSRLIKPTSLISLKRLILLLVVVGILGLYKTASLLERKISRIKRNINGELELTGTREQTTVGFPIIYNKTFHGFNFPECKEIVESTLKVNQSLLPDKYRIRSFHVEQFPTCGSRVGLLTPNLKLQNGEVFMLILVKSLPEHISERSLVRQTWGSINQILGMNFQTIFIIGKVNEPGLRNLIVLESHQHQDIIQCDFVDSFHNTTIKVLSTFRWILENRVKAKHYTFTDDGTIIKMKAVHQYFHNFTAENTVTCGWEYHERNQPVRRNNSIWYTSNTLYAKSFYPSYCQAYMYTIPASLILPYYCVSQATNVTGYFMDDVFITGMIRYKLTGSNKNILEPANKFVIYPKFLNGENKQLVMRYRWTALKKGLAEYIKQWGNKAS